jgi:hypothetical protein
MSTRRIPPYTRLLRLLHTREDIFSNRFLKKAEDVIARSEATKQSPSFPERKIASLPPVARNDTCLFFLQHPGNYDILFNRMVKN